MLCYRLLQFTSTFGLLLLLCGCVVDSAKILAIFPSPGYSQYFVGEPLLVHLAEDVGHEVTLISFHKPKRPVKNLTPILVPDLIPYHQGKTVLEPLAENIFVTISHIFDGYHTISTEKVLKDSQVQQLINSNATFDLVLLEHVANEPLMAFAHHFKAPLVVFSTIGATDWNNHLVANPAPFSYVPNTQTKFSTRMNLWERVQNFLVHTYSLYVKYFHLLPTYKATVKQFFPNAPPIENLMYNASLILLNSHPAATPPYPTTANMIEIGGFHIREELLPQDIQEFLDNSTDGAIFFSMGTNVVLEQLGEEKVQEVLEVFAGLKERVLWKLSAEDLEGKPENLLVKRWMPQRAILNHTNVKAFISHCGLISTLEAAYFGVPIICIPTFVDQSMNAALAVDKHVGITIHHQELNKHTLSEALNRIFSNKTYSENAKQRSRYFRDTPIDPMDLATYWIEFVIRHKGAPHLRNPGLNLHWRQYYYLDVLFILLVTSVLFLTFTLLLYKRKYQVVAKSKEKLH